MTVPGVYSPEQGVSIRKLDGVVYAYGKATIESTEDWPMNPNINADAALQAHVDKVIAGDGVDDSRAVEVMARAIARRRWGRSMSNADIEEMLDAYLEDARAALGALRALEGE